jgi:K+-transporting ATPase KdpF subunit
MDPIFLVTIGFFRNRLAPHPGNREVVIFEQPVNEPFPTDFRRFLDMTLFYIIGLIVAIGLVVYLFIALLKPEIFS